MIGRGTVDQDLCPQMLFIGSPAEEYPNGAITIKKRSKPSSYMRLTTGG